MDELEHNLDATSFNLAVNNYHSEFQDLITKIYLCYQLMLVDKAELPYNDENGIRDILLFKYLNNNELRQRYGLINFLFDPEVPINSGRSDIKISTNNTFIDTSAYYVIECKRLDGEAKLNKAYIKDGINRFTTNYKSKDHKYYYPSNDGINGMIGFVIKNININDNMVKIGNFFDIIENHKLYKSNHKNCKLFHLMLDISTLCK